MLDMDEKIFRNFDKPQNPNLNLGRQDLGMWSSGQKKFYKKFMQNFPSKNSLIILFFFAILFGIECD